MAANPLISRREFAALAAALPLAQTKLSDPSLVEIALQSGTAANGDEGVVSATCKMGGRPFELESLIFHFTWTLRDLSLLDWMKRKPLLPDPQIELGWRVTDLDMEFTGTLVNYLKTDKMLLLRIQRA